LNKLKILNDPIYGFISIPNELIFDLIEHPYFQRLRRISQMGLSQLVYPGAHHTRFQHAIGCMHLMQKAIRVLKFKGVAISQEESNALLIAILLHDIGHGAFSHALEHSIVNNISHEYISEQFMLALNVEFKGKLALAIQIFKGQYHRQFFHQLITSQLDIDRMDYLKRDSFFTGVSEGNINSERIITMFNVVDNDLVIEKKGLYSIEKFLTARRLMYWQVYLHKTGLVAEQLLVKVLKRANELYTRGVKLPASKSLQYFLENDINSKNKNPTDFKISLLQQKVLKKYKISKDDVHYFVNKGQISNLAYNKNKNPIKIISKNGKITDFLKASDFNKTETITKPIFKYFLYHPKEL